MLHLDLTGPARIAFCPPLSTVDVEWCARRLHYTNRASNNAALNSYACITYQEEDPTRTTHTHISHISEARKQKSAHKMTCARVRVSRKKWFIVHVQWCDAFNFVVRQVLRRRECELMLFVPSLYGPSMLSSSLETSHAHQRPDRRIPYNTPFRNGRVINDLRCRNGNKRNNICVRSFNL